MREIFGDAPAVPRGIAPDEHGGRFRSPGNFPQQSLRRARGPVSFRQETGRPLTFYSWFLRHAPGIFVTTHPQARQSRAI